MYVHACACEIVHVSSLSLFFLVGVKDACETEYVVFVSEEGITLQFQTSTTTSWSTV